MRPVKIYLNSIIGLLLGVLLISSCTKSFSEKVVQDRDFSNSSLIQVYMGTVSATRNYVYVDTKPLTGAALVLGSVFPSAAHAAKIPGGLNAFLIRDTLSTSTQTQLSFAENMQVGKYYTIFMYDTITSPKQKTVETTISIPADTSARIRFANFVYSSTSVPAVDIFSKVKNMNVFTNINVTQVTDFMPYPSGITDTFLVREAGTMNQLAALNGLTPTEKRSYTLVFRGRYATTSGSIARTLSSFVNY